MPTSPLLRSEVYAPFRAIRSSVTAETPVAGRRRSKCQSKSRASAPFESSCVRHREYYGAVGASCRTVNTRSMSREPVNIKYEYGRFKAAFQGRCVRPKKNQLFSFFR